jgi:hypothetical protein
VVGGGREDEGVVEGVGCDVQMRLLRRNQGQWYALRMRLCTMYTAIRT